ncbi:DUF6151 family protein [Pseudoxanthomonas suwonensis]|uniref:CENP-V/GFA domain-containing protein n=1 Tax=Pseudoxanthomonas suwonensis TaxID=314722 RepID=A0A0E3UPS4_9GAMM|nr:DUF6151 family protein [Pseudoxanthomonas suwonensis]AKC88070.1 hypothetical protein WQ53_16165 [Pseudoxanthomonas suwonensis]
MATELRCRCGQLRGEVDLARAHARATCYCRDCQAFARFLGQPVVLDASGGTDIVAAAPDAVRITAGAGHLAAMSMSPKGLLRWYAACCRTPLANTPRDPKVYYAGVVTACLAPGAVDATLGPRDRIVVNTGSATAPVQKASLRFLLGGLRIFGPVALARLRGRRSGAPFFDEAGRPARDPEVITRERRAELQRGDPG